MQSWKVKNLIGFATGILLFGLAICPTQAGFTSLYIFGDGVSTTTNNPLAGQYYYGLRRSNGRVWVEILAQRQGLGANSITNANWSNSSNNWSYWGQYSSNLVANLTNFPVRPDANSALFVVWVNDADFVGDMENIYPSTNIVTWTNAINQSLTNHWKVITNLYYAKNARSLIMPNAVDITKIPQYSGLASGDKSFIRQRVIDYNTAFAAMLDQARASLPGVKIYMPDMFALFDDLVAHPANYGLVNPGTAALGDPNLTDYSFDGPGANYVFWDPFDPTAKVHEIAADTVQQLISPVNITNLVLLDGSNRLDVANIPIGLNGSVDGSSNLVSGAWTPMADIDSTNTTQAIFVPTPSPWQFYQLRFPFAWSWP